MSTTETIWTTDEFDAVTDHSRRLTIWREHARMLETVKAAEMHMRKAVVGAYFPGADEGTKNFDLGAGYTLKAVVKKNYKLASNDVLDAALELIGRVGNEGEFIAERLVKFDPRLSISEYKGLIPANPTHVKIKALIDSVLTISEGSPDLKIIEPKAAG